MAILYFTLAGLFFWHLVAPAALIVNAALRVRRGWNTGRGTAFGLCYFLSVDFLALFLTDDSMIIANILLGERNKRSPLIAWCIGAGIVLVFCLVRRRLWKRDISAWEDFLMAISSGVLAASLCLWGVVSLKSHQWYAKNRRILTVRVIDATTQRPLPGVKIMFNEHVEDAKQEQLASDLNGTAIIQGLGQTRIEFTKDGYLDQVAWWRGEFIEVSWEELDGYMTPFMGFHMPTMDWRAYRTTVLLAPRNGVVQPPYVFFQCKAAKAKLYKTLFDVEHYDPNTMDPEGLPSGIKERFVAYQHQRLIAEKWFLRNRITDKTYRTSLTRKGIRVPYIWGKPYRSPQENREIAIRSFTEGDGLEPWIDGYFRHETALEEEWNNSRSHYGKKLNRMYLDSYPNSPIRPYVLLWTLFQHRKAILYAQGLPPSMPNTCDQMDFDRLKRLSMEATRHPDPLVRYMAHEIVNETEQAFR